MDTKEIKKIIEALDDTDIVELTWEKDDQKIGFRKNAARVKSEVSEDKQKDVAVSSGSSAIPQAIESKVDQNFHTIKSAMVGTFYLSPTPDTPPYVLEGSLVKKGQKIAIVEAMKIMKDISSDIEGRILKILVENGHHIEYGQPLFIIDQTGEKVASSN